MSYLVAYGGMSALGLQPNRTRLLRGAAAMLACGIAVHQATTRAEDVIIIEDETPGTAAAPAAKAPAKVAPKTPAADQPAAKKATRDVIVIEDEAPAAPRASAAQKPAPAPTLKAPEPAAQVATQDAIAIEDEAPAAPKAPAAQKPALSPTLKASEPAAKVAAPDAIDPEANSAPKTAQEPTATAKTEARSEGLSIKIETARAELAYLPSGKGDLSHTGYAHGLLGINWSPDQHWEVRLAGRLDGHLQGDAPDFRTLEADYGESYVRWRSEGFRFTAGTQTILWGRIDEVPPSDRLSVVDGTRGILDELPDRRRATPALRAEAFFGNTKLDAVWLPYFRPAVLAEQESVWFPVNQREGTVLGLPVSPLMSAIVRQARIDTDGPSGDGGFGLRLTHSGEGLDTGITLGNNRQSLPYFRYNAQTNTLGAEYPRSWVFGGDLAVQAAGATWRAEALYQDKAPATQIDGTYTTLSAINWGLGTEFFPGDSDTRVNLQLAGSRLLDAPPVIDRTKPWNLNGAVEVPFAHGRWRAKARAFVGLDKRDLYLNPEIAYLGWEPHEVFLAAHYFDGASGTVGGYFQDNTQVVLGWRAKF